MAWSRRNVVRGAALLALGGAAALAVLVEFRQGANVWRADPGTDVRIRIDGREVTGDFDAVLDRVAGSGATSYTMRPMDFAVTVP